MSILSCHVYGIRLSTDTEYRYIGATIKSLLHRLRRHFTQARYGSTTPFHQWLAQQDPEQIVIELIELCENEDQMLEREKFWIAEKREHLLNWHSASGKGTLGYQHTEETLEKMRGPREHHFSGEDCYWMYGTEREEETKAKIGTTMLIRWHEKGAHETTPRDGCPRCTLVQ